MMITIVDGSNNDSRWIPFSNEVSSIVKELESHSQRVNYFSVNSMKLTPCCGCWDCWTKTPGRCRYSDDGVDLVRSMAHSDKIVFFSPVVTGFISSEAKRALDRFIPNALPFIKLVQGECLHVNRYEKDPEFSLYLFDDNIDDRAKKIIDQNVRRVQRNMRTNIKGIGLLSKSNRQEVCNEISHS